MKKEIINHSISIYFYYINNKSLFSLFLSSSLFSLSFSLLLSSSLFSLLSSFFSLSFFFLLLSLLANYNLYLYLYLLSYIISKYRRIIFFNKIMFL